MKIDIDINIDDVVAKATERAIKETKEIVESEIAKRTIKYIDSYDLSKIENKRIEDTICRHIDYEVRQNVRHAISTLYKEKGNIRGYTEKEREAFYRGSLFSILESLEFEPDEIKKEIIEIIVWHFAEDIRKKMRKPTKEKLADLIVKALERENDEQ